MGELKAFNMPRYAGEFTIHEVYLKYEADKVIADKDKEIERLEILCANYRHDCDNLAISNEQAKRAARTLLKKMNHNKYKRCAAMARWCEATALWCYQAANTLPTGFHATLFGKTVMIETDRLYNRFELLTKWSNRWLELAEKFKEGV